MKKYVITYDLIKEVNSSVYTKIAEAIKTIGDWCRPTESTWIVNSDLSAEQIYNVLRKHTDSNDKFFVCELARNNWQGWIPLSLLQTLNSWLG